MSKIDFAPAQTTATGVLPSSVKSALMSNAVKIIIVRQTLMSRLMEGKTSQCHNSSEEEKTIQNTV